MVGKVTENFKRTEWTRFDRSAAWALFAVLIYAMLSMVPPTWFWFDPGTPYVADSTTEAAPEVGFGRSIKQDVLIRYGVTIRRAEGLTVVCDPQSSAFTYQKDATLPDHIDLVWWTGGDNRCWPREVGTYIMETCWTVVRPFWGVVPPKTVCRTSPPFRISAP